MSRADIPRGLGAYVYVLDRCEGGDMGQLAQRAAELGVAWLAPRVVGWNVPDPRNTPYMPELASACRLNGVRLGGWGYHVGLDADLRSIARSEAQTAAEVIGKYDLDFYILNAEKEYKGGISPWDGWRVRPRSDLLGAMRRWWDEIRSIRPNLSIGLTSYRFPGSGFHPEFVWEAALDPSVCDFNQPQVYAELDFQPTGPVLQLMESHRQFSEITDLPMVPLFATYPNGSWRMTYGQMFEFFDGVKVLDLPGVAPYAWDFFTTDHVQAMIDFPFEWDNVPEPPDDPPPPPPPPDEPEYPKAVRINAPRGLYIRSDASVSFRAVGAFFHGSIVELLGVDGEWGKVGNGLYIHTAYTEEL